MTHRSFLLIKKSLWLVFSLMCILSIFFVPATIPLTIRTLLSVGILTAAIAFAIQFFFSSARIQLFFQLLLICAFSLTLFSSLLLSIRASTFEQQIDNDTDVEPVQQVSSAQDMIALVNAERTKAGLPLLQMNAKLQTSATQKACQVEQKGELSHTDQNGREAWPLIEAQGYPIAYAGENLIKGYNSDEQAIVALMASERHRANILSANYKDIGIGRCGNFTVQHFGTVKYD